MDQRKIKIEAGEAAAAAVLNESNTADLVWKALPIEASANTWGDEIYFSIPVSTGTENGKEVVELGDIAFWPPGSAFCIFFGLTPASIEDEIRPASAVNVIGKVEGDPMVFKKVRPGAKIILSRIKQERAAAPGSQQ